MKDFGGLVGPRGEEARGRSRKAVIAVASVVCLAVAIAWLAQGRVDPQPETPPEQSLAEASANIEPSIDPRGETAQRYPGSPWERRNNMLQEVVTIVERGGDPYLLSGEVREYLRSIRPAVDSSCAEVLSLLGRDVVIWSGVVSYAGGLREALLRRFDTAVETWPEEHRNSMRGVKQLFVCK